jgi:GT2 family glycosyltransferase
MIDISCSIVTYKNDFNILKKAINSFLDTTLCVKLFLVDHSPTDALRQLVIDYRINYIHNPLNPGFGAGHNVAIRQVIGKSRYHLILNPDVYFNEKLLEKILLFLDTNSSIGVLMPKILYPNNSEQYLAKLLPTPIDLLARRLMPIKKVRQAISERFELRQSGYNKIMDVPFLSGCFLVFRTEVLSRINGFDDMIFMYMEDIDICRRVLNANYRSVFYPEVFVYHDHVRKSMTNFDNLKIYLMSAIYYFNKWGWFFDKNRNMINRRTLKEIQKL